MESAAERQVFTLKRNKRSGIKIREVKAVYSAMFRFWSRLSSKEEGQGLVEYALIIALIAILVIVAFPGLSDALKGIFQNITTEVGGTATGG